MTIEELAFKDRRILAYLSEKDLLDIIEFLQNDRKQWINQFSKTHNESIKIQEENQELKSQLKGTTHCYDEEEHKKLSEQLELLISKLDEYDLIVDERNQLKKQLEDEEQWRIKIAKENDEAFRGRMILIEEKEKLKKQLENCYCNRTDCSGRIKDSKVYDSLVQKVENQQKEFIKYLEDEIERKRKNATCMFEYNDTVLPLKEVLQEYKEIIGVEDENNIK